MWRAPTIDDFRAAILEDEMAAYESASVADGIQPTGKAIADSIGVFRSALRSGTTGRMGVAGTLPHDLIPQAMHVAVYYFIGGRAGFVLSEPRSTLYKDAIQLTKDIASRKREYTDPDDPEETPTDGNDPRPTFRRKPITLSRRNQEGI